MVITAQPFFNELDLLELKCRELEGVVDCHVVVESAMTFSGKPKPLYFADNAARFSQWNIDHTVIDLPADVGNWEREERTHQAIATRVSQLRPRVTIWVDTDELPRRDTVDRFLQTGQPAAKLELDYLAYYFDRVRRDICWRPSGISQGWQRVPRNRLLPCSIPRAGWHFEFFGGMETLLAKVDATSHAGEPAAVSFRRQLVAGNQDGLQSTEAYPFDQLPAYAQDNRNKYASWFSLKDTNGTDSGTG